MQQHPWIELQDVIKEKWLTQKAFSTILWKKISEVNELLKWKRNITIQRDYLLHQALWTPIKYWILKQIDYEYSLFLPSWAELNRVEEDFEQSNEQEIVNKQELKHDHQVDEIQDNRQKKIDKNEEINKDKIERARIFRSF